MIPRKQYLYIARVVLENRTGLSLATGHPDHGFDSVLVKDANGLPALPGTALAGVLRQAFLRLHGDDKDAEPTKNPFGYHEGNKGQPSRVHVGWGCLLDQNGRAVFRLKLAQVERDELRKDTLLGTLIETDHQRQRVRLNHRGVAADTGKFDRAVLPAGHRFAVELCLESDQPDDSAWSELLGLLASGKLRLGGGTRAGMGRMELVACLQRCFDLENSEDAKAYRELGSSPGDTAGLETHKPEAVSPGNLVSGKLHLHCEDFFRFGGQAGDPGNPEEPGKPADMLPKFEPVIRWDSSNGRAHKRAGVLLVPGSSVKGALAHRFAFHYNALTGVFAEQMDSDQIADWDKTANCPGTQALFGYVKPGKTVDGEVAGAGCLFIDDARLSIESDEMQRLMHVAIDQFTGGARQGMLFEEQLVTTDQTIVIELCLDRGRLAGATEEDGRLPNEATVLKALRRAIHDLTTGLLPLGAASGRGHGFFTGRLEGPLAETLSNAEEQPV